MYYLFLLFAGLSDAAQVLDDFSYVDAAVAQKAWRPSEGIPPLAVVSEGDRKVVQLSASFATNHKLARVSVDRDMKIDLSRRDGFDLQFSADLPEAVQRLTLYFHSGTGWYACSKTLRGRVLLRKPADRIRFERKDFRSEGNPASWKQIDTIRISIWRGEDKDLLVRLRSLRAFTHAYLLIAPTPDMAASSDYQTAIACADRLKRFLEVLNLDFGVGDEKSLLQSALEERRTVFLPYTPQLSEDAVHALERFVENGGKIFAFYQLPPQLAEAMGFKKLQYVRQARSGQFAEVRFTARDLVGLPESMWQSSWNITTLAPIGHHARAIGNWFDDRGMPTGQAACFLSDRGAFFSHIFLDEDKENHQALLAAILGYWNPRFWETLSLQNIRGAMVVGHFSNESQALLYFREIANQGSSKTLAAAFDGLKNASELHQQGQTCLDNKPDEAGKLFGRSLDFSRKSRQIFVNTYLQNQPSPAREGRAVWNHSGTGAYPGDWERSTKLLNQNSFNMVLPNMLSAGSAHYPSDILPRSETFKKYGDQLEQCCAAAKKYGLEVHVWKVNFNLSNAPKKFVEKLRREGRTQINVKGESLDWLCPSHLENRKLELQSMLEVARKYPVAGLHFDYIRYPDASSCYCSGCRERFEKESVTKVENWPRDCHSGSRKDEYNAWRCKQITALVAAVHDEAKKIRPEIKISAAVFGGYPDCRMCVAQDWPAWIEAGYLDFVCPMDYTDNDDYFQSLVKNQLKLIDKKIPVYPGIGATATQLNLSTDRVVGQIHFARELGAAGFTLFNFDQNTAEVILPCIGSGVGKKHAVPLHHPFSSFPTK